MLLSGRIALVTGAAQGNGAAIAAGLAAEGVRVVATDLDAVGAERTAASIRQTGSEAWALGLDVTEVATLLAALDRVRNDGTTILVIAHDVGFVMK